MLRMRPGPLHACRVFRERSIHKPLMLSAPELVSVSRGPRRELVRTFPVQNIYRSPIDEAAKRPARVLWFRAIFQKLRRFAPQMRAIAPRVLLRTETAD